MESNELFTKFADERKQLAEMFDGLFQKLAADRGTIATKFAEERRELLKTIEGYQTILDKQSQLIVRICERVTELLNKQPHDDSDWWKTGGDENPDG